MPTRRTASLASTLILGRDNSLLPKSKNARRVAFRLDQLSASGTTTAALNPIRQRQTNPKAGFAPDGPAAIPLFVLRAAITAACGESRRPRGIRPLLRRSAKDQV